jgi:hypothetical protein
MASIRALLGALPLKRVGELVEGENVEAGEAEVEPRDSSARIPRCLRRKSSDGPTPMRADSSSSLVLETLPGTPM